MGNILDYCECDGKENGSMDAKLGTQGLIRGNGSGSSSFETRETRGESGMEGERGIYTEEKEDDTPNTNATKVVDSSIYEHDWGPGPTTPDHFKRFAFIEGKNDVSTHFSLAPPSKAIMNASLNSQDAPGNESISFSLWLKKMTSMGAWHDRWFVLIDSSFILWGSHLDSKLKERLDHQTRYGSNPIKLDTNDIAKFAQRHHFSTYLHMSEIESIQLIPQKRRSFSYRKKSNPNGFHYGKRFYLKTATRSYTFECASKVESHRIVTKIHFALKQFQSP